MFLQHHGTIHDLNPAGLGRIQSSISGHCVLHMRRQATHKVEYWNFQCLGLPIHGDVCPPDVLLHQHGQVPALDILLPVVLVHGQEIMRTLLIILTKMMPHKIVQDWLRDAIGLHLANISLLISPLYPPRLCCAGIHQHQAVHPLWVEEGMSDEDVGAKSYSNTNKPG